MQPPRPTTILGEDTRMEDSWARRQMIMWRIRWRTWGPPTPAHGPEMARSGEKHEMDRDVPFVSWNMLVVRCGDDMTNRSRTIEACGRAVSHNEQFEQCNGDVPQTNRHPNPKHLDIGLWNTPLNPMLQRFCAKSRRGDPFARARCQVTCLTIYACVMIRIMG